MLSWCTLTLIALQATAPTVPVKPEYDRYVVDEAGVLDVHDRARIAAPCC